MNLVTTLQLFLFVSLLAVLYGCGKPTAAEFIGEGVNCKAQITMPETKTYYAGDVVDVRVRIYDCK